MRLTPSLPRLLTLLVAVVLGAVLGNITVSIDERRSQSMPPAGWELESRRGFVTLLSDEAESATPGWWSLSRFRGIQPLAAPGPVPLQVELRLGEQGEVTVWLHAEQGEVAAGTPGVKVKAGGDDISAEVILMGVQHQEATSCLVRAPAASSVVLQVEPTASGLRLGLGGREHSCSQVTGDWHPVVRPGQAAVGVRDLRLGEAQWTRPETSSRVLYGVVGAALLGVVTLVELLVGGRAIAVLLTTLPLVGAALLSDRDPVSLVQELRTPWLSPVWAALLLPGALSLGLKVTYHLTRSVKEPSLAGAGGPAPRALTALGAVALGVGLSLAGAPVWLSVLGVGIAALLGLWLLPWALARLGSLRPDRSAGWLVLAAGLCAVALLPLQPLSPLAIACAALGGLGGAIAMWSMANAQKVRAYELVLLAGVALALWGLENAVRWTQAGPAWGPAALETTVSDEALGAVALEFVALEQGERTSYPKDSFPVAVAARTQAPRVVALGSSSTGGAFQNSDLSEFYPAMLAEALGGRVDVVNQGVGGWTTWHVRRYLDAYIDELDPDVITLYIGHNDQLGYAPAPYADLWERYSGTREDPGLGAVVLRSRLVVGSAFLVRALSPRGDRAAPVPVHHAIENLLAIIELAASRDTKVILMSEGLSPDPEPLSGYFAMLERIARRTDGVSYIDTASALHRAAGSATIFLDDCHLTRAGHEVVVGLLVEELRALGVADDQPGSAP